MMKNLLDKTVRNILAIGLYYDREDIDRKEYHFTYRITEEDYNQSIFIPFAFV